MVFRTKEVLLGSADSPFLSLNETKRRSSAQSNPNVKRKGLLHLAETDDRVALSVVVVAVGFSFLTIAFVVNGWFHIACCLS